MTKQEQARQLLAKINALEKKEVLDVDMNGLIAEEVAKITEQVKQNPTMKVLQKFNSELEKFKQDFNLKPIIDSIKGLQQEIKQSEKNLLSEFQSRINDIPNTPDLTSNLAVLKAEFETRIANLPDLKPELDNIQKQLQDLVTNDIQADKDLRAGIENKLGDEIGKLKSEFNSRLSKIGGGQAAPRIQVNSSLMSTRYADINYIGTGISKADNNTTKQVDITILGAKKRVVATTQSATPAINTDNGDIFEIVGLAQAITSMTTNLTGSPSEGDIIEIIFKDNATARGITWGAGFSSSGTVNLPSTTVISTTLSVILQRETSAVWTSTSTWVCKAVA